MCAIRNPSDLQEEIERRPIGSVQDVKVLRKGEEMTLKIELAPLDDTADSDATDKDGARRAPRRGAEKDDQSSQDD